MNNSSATESVPAPPRLSMGTRLSLREIIDLLGEKGHAQIWAAKFEVRKGELPTSRQVVSGLERDISIKVSLKSAERALCTLRATRSHRRY